jgi:hypothetical protein
MDYEEIHSDAVDLITSSISKRKLAALHRAYNDEDLLRHANEVRKEFTTTKGFSKDRNMRWVGTVPTEVYDKACELYGEQVLLRDKKLLKKLFAPWILVNKEGL